MLADDGGHRRKEEDGDFTPPFDTAPDSQMDPGLGVPAMPALPDVGIPSMEERLEYLRAELAKWTAAQERYPARADAMGARVTELRDAIADAEAWLAESRSNRDSGI